MSQSFTYKDLSGCCSFYFAHPCFQKHIIMNGYNINLAAEKGNDPAMISSQLNKPDNDTSLHHDAVFGDISDEGPDYRSVSRFCHGKWHDSQN